MKKFKIVFGAFLIGMLVSAGFAQTSSFPDVKSTDWFYPYVMKIKNWGIVNGTGDGTFDPSGTINRAQFSKMLSLYDERVDEKIAAVSGGGTGSNLPSVMYLWKYAEEADQCPSGWTDVNSGKDMKMTGSGTPRFRYERTCITDRTCQVIHLSKYGEQPNACPSGWSEASVGATFIDGGTSETQYTRSCYICGN